MATITSNSQQQHIPPYQSHPISLMVDYPTSVSVNTSNTNLAQASSTSPTGEQKHHGHFLRKILFGAAKKYAICLVGGLLMLDTILMFLLLFLSSLNNSMISSTSGGKNGTNNSLLWSENSNNGKQLRCHCPPPTIVLENQNNNTLTPILSDGENHVTDCRPVWNHGPLRRVFICKFLPTPTGGTEQGGEDQIEKMRQKLLVLKRGGGDGGDVDYGRMVQEFERWKKV